jgi:metallo-beta-lactamase class B
MAAGAFARTAAVAFARTAAVAMLLCSTFPVFADDIPKEWLAPQLPVRLLGNTYYVGTRGLASILITSDEGHVLIDGGLIDSAPLIAANIQTLGFKLEDVRTLRFRHERHSFSKRCRVIADSVSSGLRPPLDDVG